MESPSEYGELIQLSNVSFIVRNSEGKYLIQDGDKIDFIEDVKVAKVFETSGADDDSEDAYGERQIDGLPYDTYEIFEVRKTDDTYLNTYYNITTQDGYVAGTFDRSGYINGWVDLGKIEVSQEQGHGPKNPATKIVTRSGVEKEFAYNTKSVGDLKISKSDSRYTNLKLEGAEFKVQQIKVEDGVEKISWIGEYTGVDPENPDAPTYVADRNAAKTFGADGNGEITIPNVEFATYRIYEIKAPVGYDITKQDGYNATYEGWVTCSPDVVVSKESTEAGTNEIRISLSNKKIISLKGKVWLDNIDVKDQSYSDQNDYYHNESQLFKDGLTVELYDRNDTIIGTTLTDSNGEYVFTTKTDGTPLYYWDIVNGYVKFVYNDKEYITVTPFVGNNVQTNSKAQEKSMVERNQNGEIVLSRLDDNNMPGGAAVTYKSNYPFSVVSDAKTIVENGRTMQAKLYNGTATADDWKTAPLTSYYDESDYTVKYIDLGLREKVEPSYDISEQLAYIKVKLNGFTYTYLYDSDGDLNEIKSNYVPTVQEQLTKSSYSFAMYPSDVAYSANQTKKDNKMKVYVVYKINVTNTTNIFIDKVYYEQKLKLSSLTNTYDTTRYELVSSEPDKDETFKFNLWTDENKDGIAEFDLASKDAGNVYADGITNNLSSQNTTISSYIKFKITDDVVEGLLDGKNDVNKAISNKVNTKAYHDYTRQDNVWTDDDAELQRTVDLQYTGSKEDKKYTHKSIEQEKDCTALGLKLKLGEDRVLSGTVFEDNKAEDKENKGNGIIDNNENKANKVAVQLVDINGNTVARYPNYKKTNNKEENMKADDTPVLTDDNGNFEMLGVVPGYYYLQYTYGNGEQEIVGKPVNLVDYKSTIVTDDQAKNAMKSTAFDGAKNVASMQQDMEDYYNGIKTADAVKASKDIMEWYKASKKDHSVASDDINVREKLNGYEYHEDGSIYNANKVKVDNGEGYINATDENGTVIVDSAGNTNKMTMSSYTPMVGISIENDEGKQGEKSDKDVDGENVKENVQIPTYDGFNLGVIKETVTNLSVEKKMVRVQLTNQIGSVLVDQNPKTLLSLHISDLDGVTEGGSKYAKLEMEKDNYVGSTLKPTYQLTITNNSDEDYIETEDQYKGNYFKYGDKDHAVLKETDIREVIDELDLKYDYDNVEGIVTQTKNEKESPNKVTLKSETIDSDEALGENHKHITITGWDKIATGDNVSIEYTPTALLGNVEDDTEFKNEARIAKLSLDNLSTLAILDGTAWGDTYKDHATLTVVPNTGKDRSNIYIITAAVALVALGIGFIIIKKRVLK